MTTCSTGLEDKAGFRKLAREYVRALSEAQRKTFSASACAAVALMKEFASEDIKIKSFRGGLFSNVSDEDINEKTYNLLQRLSDTNAISRRGVDEVMDENKLCEVVSQTHKNAELIDDDEKLIEYLKTAAGPDDAIVFLGSHGFRGMIDVIISPRQPLRR